MAPLFVLIAVRGSNLIPDVYLLTACLVLILMPNVVLWMRIRTAQRLKEIEELDIGDVEDQRRHLFEYLFAVLLPLFALPIDRWRDLVAMVLALMFIAFVFWRLNLHYMNVVFAVRGYGVYTIRPKQEGNHLTDRRPRVLITKQMPREGTPVFAYRLSDTVYLEQGR